jgi:predicted RNase H-like nuclease (RuvC/YqgF family)
MFRYNYENQDSNTAFTMGNEKPTRRERTTTASKAAKSVYKREMQNIARLIRQLKREQENMADRPLTDTQTSEIADAIDSGAYVSKEIEIGVKIRDLEKKLESAKKRFQFLFGNDY